MHCGAQTTADTVELVRHAVGAGADAVAVIGPPYYAYDERGALRPLRRRGGRGGGDALLSLRVQGAHRLLDPAGVIERLGDRVAGLKVSNKPFEAVEPFLLEGKDVFIGAEELVERGLAAGAAGSVSGLAAAFPEGGQPERRAVLERYPFHAALKVVIGWRGVPVREDVRHPLRLLTEEERAELVRWLESS